MHLVFPHRAMRLKSIAYEVHAVTVNAVQLDDDVPQRRYTVWTANPRKQDQDVIHAIAARVNQLNGNV